MSGLAKLLSKRGYEVSGSDRQASSTTRELEKRGIKVYYSHSSNNIDGVDLVVYSSAIGEDNPELSFAKENNKLIVKRSELLGEILSSYKRSIAISGCHGKTTSTAMLAHIMTCARVSPTVFLGGEYGDYGNFLDGNGDLAIAEACEYKKSFLDIKPKISVVLNIDNDHLDSYDGMKDLVFSFRKFVGENLAVINADDRYANEISNCTTVTFGVKNVATYYAKEVVETPKGVSFTAYAYAKPCGKINLKLNGIHNVYNALSAFATADVLGVPFSFIKKGLESFNGVKRRNEYLGNIKGLECFADYAHHPSEIKATLSAFKSCGDDFITVFQPHTYSRTKILMNDFIEAFSGLNNLIIYKTFPARENFDIKGSAKTLYGQILKNGQVCEYAHTQTELFKQITRFSAENKRVVFLGAGDIYDLAKKLIAKK